MEKNTRLTLVGFGVTVITLCFLVAIIMPQMGRVKRGAQRIVCGTNLKGIGTAFTVYANDYDGEYTKLGGGQWAKELAYEYDNQVFKMSLNNSQCTISSSLYLLVREADMSPKSFVCPESDEMAFDGRSSTDLDIIQMWDFGRDPYSHVSYAYHNPYGRFPADTRRKADFAVLADMSPWFYQGDIVGPGQNPRLWSKELPKGTILKPPQLFNTEDEKSWKLANSNNHFSVPNIVDALFETRLTQGQNVLYADGHSEFVKFSNAGLKNDNVYTYWSVEEDPTDQDRQGGTAPTGRSPENDAKSKDDSFLAI